MYLITFTQKKSSFLLVMSTLASNLKSKTGKSAENADIDFGVEALVLLNIAVL